MKTNLFNAYRTSTKRKMFSAKNSEELQFIKYLTQKKGLNLQGVKVILEAVVVAQKSGVDLKSSLFSGFTAEKLF